MRRKRKLPTRAKTWKKMTVYLNSQANKLHRTFSTYHLMPSALMFWLLLGTLGYSPSLALLNYLSIISLNSLSRIKDSFPALLLHMHKGKGGICKCLTGRTDTRWSSGMTFGRPYCDSGLGASEVGILVAGVAALAQLTVPSDWGMS